MTFESSDQEMELIWRRSATVRMLKLFDKVSNLMDGAWMSSEKREKYKSYVLSLADDVESNFGVLNIVRIARTICA